MTNVLITIDTEVYPIRSNWRKERLVNDIDRDIYGRVGTRELGLCYQLELLKSFGLRAVFFIESLFASSRHVGLGPLTEIVSLLKQYSQDVQLHLHPEWVSEIPGTPVRDRGYLLNSYSEDEQCKLIEVAAENLIKAGASPPSAFRAGDYAANACTLRALARLGFKYDTSYNVPYLSSTCHIAAPRSLWQPAHLEGVWELPISCFADWANHFRHCQVCACSGHEMQMAARQAASAGWQTFVIVSHSFELLANRRSSRGCPTVAVANIKRLHSLCKFLSENRTILPTVRIEALNLRPRLGNEYLCGSMMNTAGRICEQIYERISHLTFINNIRINRLMPTPATTGTAQTNFRA